MNGRAEPSAMVTALRDLTVSGRSVPLGREPEPHSPFG